MKSPVPLHVTFYANALQHPIWASIWLGTAAGLPLGAIFGVVLPGIGIPVPVPEMLPTWGRVALGAPAGWIVMYLQLTKPY